jgi:hypothetical protein
MKSIFLEKFYRNIHPALKDVGILYLHELKNGHKNNSPLFLLGDEHSCELFKERLNHYHIQVEGFIIISVDMTTSKMLLNNGECIKELPLGAIVVVTFQDYPGNIKLFQKVQRVIIYLNITRPYIIHDFSSGFAVGAEHIVNDKEYITEVYNFLSDSSKDCFCSFLEHITTPYRWNMDIKSVNYGIPDKFKVENGNMTFEQYVYPKLEEGYVLFCDCTEFRKTDPKWRLISKSKCIIFSPNYLVRLRLREYFDLCGINYNVPIVISALWDSNGSEKISFSKYTGGTPLLYERYDSQVSVTTVDTVMESLRDERLQLIILDMDDNYQRAINGARNTITRNHPVIIIKGFSHADYLWNAIRWIKFNLPQYSVSLTRFPSDNILQGHSIVLE